MVAADMSPEDFLMWFRGVIDGLGGRNPTAAQWRSMRGAATSVIGRLVADKMTRPTSAPIYPYPSRDRAEALSRLKAINDLLQDSKRSDLGDFYDSPFPEPLSGVQ